MSTAKLFRLAIAVLIQHWHITSAKLIIVNKGQPMYFVSTPRVDVVKDIF